MSTTRSSPNLLLKLLAFAAIYVIWGSTYLAIRVAIDTIPPFLMAGSRFLVAGGLMYVWARLGKRAARPTAYEWRGAAMVGLLLMVGGNGLVTWAEQLITSGVAAVLVATMPLWMAALDARFFGGPRPTGLTVAGLLGGLLGVVVLIAPSAGDVRSVHPGGALLVVLAASLWATGSLLSRRVALPSTLTLSVAMQMLAGGAVLVVLGLATGEWSRVDLAAVSARSFFALVYLIVFGSIVAISAYVWLLRVAAPAAVATYAFVNPIVAVGLGWALLDEPVSARTAAAAVLIIGSVVILLAAKGRDRRPPAVRADAVEPVLPLAPTPLRALIR